MGNWGPADKDDKLGNESSLSLPPLMLIYTCRHTSELRVLLPLLKYSHAISIHIFYTGKEALETCMLDMPSPIASPALGEHGSSRSPSDSELGLPSQAKSIGLLGGLVLPKMIEGRDLNFVVICLTFFAFYWAIVRTPAVVVMVILYS
jgi:hypothetical protein